MRTALNAFIVCVIALIGLVAVPVVVLFAHDVGVATPVLATAIGGLLLGAVILAARGKQLQHSAPTGSTPTAQWLAQTRLVLGEKRRPQSAPIFINSLLGATPVLQWAFLVSRTWPKINLGSVAVCLAIGVAGMSGVAIWSLRRSGLGDPPRLPKAPWQTVALGAAGLSLIAFEALIKHSFVAIICAFLLVDLLLMRLLIVCMRWLKR